MGSLGCRGKGLAGIEAFQQAELIGGGTNMPGDRQQALTAIFRRQVSPVTGQGPSRRVDRGVDIGSFSGGTGAQHFRRGRVDRFEQPTIGRGTLFSIDQQERG